MGTPVNCVDDASIINGDFSSSDEWHVGNQWEISDDVASVDWPGFVADINLFQHLPLVNGETYVIDFEVLEANCPAVQGIIVRLGGFGGPESALIKTVGYKRVVLQYNNLGGWLLFFIRGSQNGPGDMKIDNVLSCKLESFIACTFNFMGYPGTKYEWLDLGGGLYNVRYANPDGSSSVWFAWDINSF